MTIKPTFETSGDWSPAQHAALDSVPTQDSSCEGHLGFVSKAAPINSKQKGTSTCRVVGDPRSLGLLNREQGWKPAPHFPGGSTEAQRRKGSAQVSGLAGGPSGTRLVGEATDAERGCTCRTPPPSWAPTWPPVPFKLLEARGPHRKHVPGIPFSLLLLSVLSSHPGGMQLAS